MKFTKIYVMSTKLRIDTDKHEVNSIAVPLI